MPTARENGRRRGEGVPGVHPDGREALRGAGRLLGRCRCGLRDGTTHTAAKDALCGRETRENDVDISNVCRMKKPPRTPYRGIVSGAVRHAGMARTARGYFWAAARYAGQSGTADAIRHKKSPGQVRGGGYLKRRAALNRTASGSRSRNKTGMRPPPILLYHICGKLSRGTSAPTWPRRRKCPRRRAPLHQSASWPSLPV